MTLGETFWSFGIFFKPLESEFGWTRSVVSSIFTAFLLGYALSVIVTGELADRSSPQPILLGSALLVGLGLSLCSVAESVAQFRTFLLLVGLGSGATWSVPLSTVQRCFYKRHRAGLALGIVLSGTGIGALIFPPLVNYMILHWGWRKTFFAMGLLFFGITVAASTVLRQGPWHLARKGQSELNPPCPMSYLGPGILTSRPFLAVTFITSAGVFTFQLLAAHLVRFAMDVGISPSASALSLSLIGGCSIPSRIISGHLAERLAWRRLLALSFFGMAGSITWLLLVRETWMLFSFALLYGIFHGARMASQTGVLPEIFGPASLGRLIGASSAVSQLCGAFAPYLAGVIFDAAGSYSFAFMGITVLLVTAGLVATRLRPQATKGPGFMASLA
jgi:MFS family permease